MDVSFSKLRETVKDRVAWCGAVHGAANSIKIYDWTTEQQQQLYKKTYVNKNHNFAEHIKEPKSLANM